MPMGKDAIPRPLYKLNIITNGLIMIDETYRIFPSKVLNKAWKKEAKIISKTIDIENVYLSSKYTSVFDYLINSQPTQICFNLGSGKGYTVLEIIKESGLDKRAFFRSPDADGIEPINFWV